MIDHMEKTNANKYDLQHTHSTSHLNNHITENTHKNFSWTAVIVGALVGVGITFLLNLFSIAIGLSAFNLTTAGATTLAIGGCIGLAFATVIAMFTAGWVAGYFGRAYYVHHKNIGALYGFTSWCVALILMVVLAADVGRYVNTYTTFLVNPAAIINNTTIATTTSNNNTLANPTSRVQINTTPTSSANAVFVNNQKIDGSLAISASVIFALFSIGALASCFGGYFGMYYRRIETNPDIEITKNS